MSLPVGYVFYFEYFIYRLIGITFCILFGFRIFQIFFSLFEYLNLGAIAKFPFFLQLWHVVSRDEHLWLSFHFSASKNLQFLLGFSLSVLFRFFPVCVILCVGSSFFLSRFDTSCFSTVFLLFLLLYVFCCICSTTFGTSKHFSFKNLSRSFLSLIDLINFDISALLLKFGESCCFSRSIIFSQWSCGVSVFVCSAQKTLLGCFCFFPVNNICCTFWLVLFCGVFRYPDRLIWCVASGPSAQRKSCLLSPLLYSIWFR